MKFKLYFLSLLFLVSCAGGNDQSRPRDLNLPPGPENLFARLKRASIDEIPNIVKSIVNDANASTELAEKEANTGATVGHYLAKTDIDSALLDQVCKVASINCTEKDASGVASYDLVAETPTNLTKDILTVYFKYISPDTKLSNGDTFLHKLITMPDDNKRTETLVWLLEEKPALLGASNSNNEKAIELLTSDNFKYLSPNLIDAFATISSFNDLRDAIWQKAQSDTELEAFKKRDEVKSAKPMIASVEGKTKEYSPTEGLNAQENNLIESARKLDLTEASSDVEVATLKVAVELIRNKANLTAIINRFETNKNKAISEIGGKTKEIKEKEKEKEAEAEAELKAKAEKEAREAELKAKAEKEAREAELKAKEEKEAKAKTEAAEKAEAVKQIIEQELKNKAEKGTARIFSEVEPQKIIPPKVLSDALKTNATIKTEELFKLQQKELSFRQYVIAYEQVVKDVADPESKFRKDYISIQELSKDKDVLNAIDDYFKNIGEGRLKAGKTEFISKINKQVTDAAQNKKIMDLVDKIAEDSRLNAFEDFDDIRKELVDALENLKEKLKGPNFDATSFEVLINALKGLSTSGKDQNERKANRAEIVNLKNKLSEFISALR